VVQGTAHSLNVDGDPVLGWAMPANGATGLACEYRARVLMWLGTEGTVIPKTIYTNDVSRLRMDGRIL
jgi:hypothetical protein